MDRSREEASEEMTRSFVPTLSLLLSRILQQAVRYFNPMARLILASRLHGLMSSRVMLLAFTGRKTGRSYTTPVSYVREGRSLLVPAGGAWWKNLGDGGRSWVRLKGTWRLVNADVISEPAALKEVLRRMLVANPAIAVFIGIRPRLGGVPDPDALERERRRGFVVVRLHLDGEKSILDAAPAVNAVQATVRKV